MEDMRKTEEEKEMKGKERKEKETERYNKSRRIK